MKKPSISYHRAQRGHVRRVVCLALALAWAGSLPAPKIARASGASAGVSALASKAAADGADVFAPAAFLTTRIVTNTLDSGAGSLRDVIAAAGIGDTIQFSLTANSVITLTSAQLTIGKRLTIDGTTATNVAVSGNNTFRVFNVTAPLTVISLTIQNGNASTDGGGISSSGAVTLTNVAFISNTAASFGGGASIAGAARVSGGVFQDNRAPTAFNGGGGLYVGNTLNLSDTQFIGNSAGGEGGGLYASGGSAIIANSTFISNTAGEGGGGGGGGGASFAFNTAPTISGSLFQLNSATGSGGGIYAYNSTPTMFVTATQFLTNSTAWRGGGLQVQGKLSLSGVTFISNSAPNEGGGANAFGLTTVAGGLFQLNQGLRGGGLAASSANVSGTQFVGNTSSDSGGGGGLYTSGAATLTGASFTANHAGGGSGQGGGASVGGLATVSGGWFSLNYADFAGGGLNAGSVNLTSVAFLTNTAGAFGGGLVSGGASNISDTMFVSNTSSGSGGGADITGVTADITNSTFLRNAASGDGGGASFSSSVAATVSGGSFQRNSSQGSGGGIATQNAVTVQGTTFLTNTAANNGGGLRAGGPSGAASITSAIFGNNTAGDSGGGASLGYPATVSRSLFQLNRALAGVGGGIEFGSGGALILGDTRFLTNTAGIDGGGAYAATTSDATITNSIFISNTATGGAGGGVNLHGTVAVIGSLFARNEAPNGKAIYMNAFLQSAKVVFTTIAGSVASGGAAISVNGNSVSITDTIITSHSVGINVNSGTLREDYNLFFANTANTAGVGITSGTHHPSGDPMFINPAADDYHLRRGSPAIDAGTNAGVTTDIDGQKRPIGAGFDIGYDEVPYRVSLALILGP